MSEKKAILMVSVKIDKDHMQDVPSYLEQITPIFAKNGGKPLAKYKVSQEVSGEKNPEMISIVEFENAEAINNMVNSDAFKSLASLRARIFSQLNLVICEEA